MSSSTSSSSGETSEGRPYQVIEGFKVPKSFSVERFISAINYVPRDDDVFVATYPRCGTTWTQQIVYLIYHGGEAPASAADFYRSSPYLDMFGSEAAEGMPRPGLIKVHLPFGLVPYSSRARYIYVCRNPKDCAVSLYHFVTKTVGATESTFDEFFELFVAGELPYGDYFDHLESWYEHADDPNVLFLTYEEMKEDPARAVVRIASFLGKEYADALANDEFLLENILRKSSVGFMRENLNKQMIELNRPSKALSEDPSVPEGLKEVVSRRNVGEKGAFVREGVVGGWKDYFSEEQSRRLDAKFLSRMKDSKLEALWRKYMQ